MTRTPLAAALTSESARRRLGSIDDEAATRVAVQIAARAARVGREVGAAMRGPR